MSRDNDSQVMIGYSVTFIHCLVLRDCFGRVDQGDNHLFG